MEKAYTIEEGEKHLPPRRSGRLFMLEQKKKEATKPLYIISTKRKRVKGVTNGAVLTEKTVDRRERK